MDSSVTEFRTRNLTVAAFLRHLHFDHICSEMVGRASIIFVFDDPSNECETIERNVFSGCGTTDAMALISAYREVCQTMNVARADGKWVNKDN
jgi:hypothetical protein